MRRALHDLRTGTAPRRAQRRLHAMTDDADSSRPNGARPHGRAPQSRSRRATEIAVLVDCADWESVLPACATLARRAAAAALAAAGPTPADAELCIVLADDATLRRLNRDFRGRDRPTNVLAFPAEDARDAAPEAPVLLGDVVISLETLQREAAAQGKTPAQHLCHLTVHGVLHLLGYDHRDAAEATRMEALETRVLDGLGVPDPYGPASDDRPAERAVP